MSCVVHPATHSGLDQLLVSFHSGVFSWPLPQFCGESKSESDKFSHHGRFRGWRSSISSSFACNLARYGEHRVTSAHCYYCRVLSRVRCEGCVSVLKDRRERRLAWRWARHSVTSAQWTRSQSATHTVCVTQSTGIFGMWPVGGASGHSKLRSCA